MADDVIQQRAHNFKDLTGQRFGRLTVVAFSVQMKRKARWQCRCDCGQEKVIGGYQLRAGITASCGCLKSEQMAARSLTHGATRGSSRGAPRPTEYLSWAHIIQRCTNPRNRAWKHYGGRGITVCAEWRNSFAAFLAHVGPKPQPDMSIERIDNERGYETGNVKWATDSEQSRNRRPFVLPKNKPTHCPSGHPYIGDNIYVLASGVWRCQTCRKRQGAETYRRKKERRSHG